MYYKLDFKIPSCTCPDWTHTNYPCKHFFAVFHVYPSWDWNALPSSYLDSPRLKLDSKAVESYFSHTAENPAPVTLDPGLDENQDIDSNNLTGNIPKRKVGITHCR